MALTIASSHLDDAAFLSAVESCELPLSCFRHGDHLRLAWLYLHQQPFEQALCSVRSSIMGLAAFHGVSQIFHQTLTTAWVKLLHTHTESTFAEFVAVNESRLHIGLLHQFWTPTRLESEAARQGWVSPDRAELPV
jgi:hypothetical protein